MSAHEPHVVVMKVLVRHVAGCTATEEDMLESVRQQAAEMAAENLLTVLWEPILVGPRQWRDPASNRLITVDVYEIVAECPGSL